MTIWNVLYTLSIRPLEILFECIFAIVYRFVSNPGIVLIFLSLLVNLLVLPLYRRADEMQENQRNIEARLKPWVTHIKKTFSGEERFMMLQTYYRQNNYKPTDALKGSISLLLEIPFFIAAYRFLSGLRLLKGVSFGPVQDLASPDGLLILWGETINVLPILMTLINILSAAIYLKGAPFKSKIQTYGMALIFLVLLYDSPSGLVFYWTLNNVFSLMKNIYNKVENPEIFLRIILFFTGIFVQEYFLILQPLDSQRKNAVVAVLCLLLQVPLLLRNVKMNKIQVSMPEAAKRDDIMFTLGCIFMTILTGVLISSTVIKSSTADFVNINAYYSPLWYVLTSFLLSAGTFMIWFGVFYTLASPVGKKIMALMMWILAVCSTINYMFFGKNRGELASSLVYEKNPIDSFSDCAVNIIVLILVSVSLYFIWRKKENFVNFALLSLCLAAVTLSAGNIIGIEKDLSDIRKAVQEKQGSIPEIPLSRNGKNVVILMMDRAIGFYVPFIMEERPDLLHKFDGFTFYPNTLSFATNTNVALPPVYGGYEYTPTIMNSRLDKSLAEKHNEALRLMPVLFDEAGYDVTIFSPSYANYQEPPDLHIYDDHPDIKAYDVNGMFTSPEVERIQKETLNRNFYCFGIYKIAPLILQPSLYSYGFYNDADAIAGKNGDKVPYPVYKSLTTSMGLNISFLRYYDVLSNLSAMTVVDDSDHNHFFAVDNGTAHQPVLLQLPDYTVSSMVDNSEYENNPIRRVSLDGREIEFDFVLKMTHYHANMAAYLKLGEWMDYLRKNGVYDNTRIIIVADHGSNQRFSNHILGEEDYEDILFFNPVLMVKDFGGEGFRVDEQFMTNADVPTITMKGLLKDPVNPATGNPVTDEAKAEPTHDVQWVKSNIISGNDGNIFQPGGWFRLHGDNIFDRHSWEKLGIY